MSNPPPHNTPAAADVYALLPLPKVSGLSDAQTSGGDCVWCAATLTPETVRDLGVRPGPGGQQIHPRGCADCARDAARRVYAVHSRTCSACVRDVTACGVRRALRRLALEGRR